MACRFTFVVRLIDASQGENAGGGVGVDVPDEEGEYWHLHDARLCEPNYSERRDGYETSNQHHRHRHPSKVW